MSCMTMPNVFIGLVKKAGTMDEVYRFARDCSDLNRYRGNKGQHVYFDNKESLWWIVSGIPRILPCLAVIPARSMSG